MDKIIKANEFHGNLRTIYLTFSRNLFNILWYKTTYLPVPCMISVSASRIIDGTTTLREGDIAVSTGRRSKICFARSCLWSKSVDGHVYIAYNISPDYSILLKFDKSIINNIHLHFNVYFIIVYHFFPTTNQLRQR